MVGARRIACVEPCRIQGEVSLQGLLWNLSTRGVYVVIEPVLVPGQRVRLSFSMPGDDAPLNAEARVVWQNPRSAAKGCGARAASLPPGCGLEFVAIDESDLARIEQRVRTTPEPRRSAVAHH